jgi:ABC-type multidrug transport system ATPase subunit
MATVPPLLQVDRLSRRFGALEVVRDLDVVLQPGQRLALTGHNGAGKSTVLRCIAGVVSPTSGSITIAGHQAGSRAARALTGGAMTHERAFYMRLTARDNLETFARLRGLGPDDARRDVAALVDELELERIIERRMDRCSTGMIQQCAFARSLLGSPRLLLLDEPTRSLDSDARDRLWAAIDRRADVGLVIASHREDDIERCAEVIALG